MSAVKQCSTCGETKPLAEFNRRKDSKDGYRGYCRACHVISATKWIHSNRERFNARIREDRARNPLKYKQWSDTYRERSPVWEEMSRVRTNARRRRVVEALPKWADKEAIKAVYAEAARRKKETGKEWQVDHIVPLRSEAVCGLHCPDNLRVVEKVENQRKSNREWPDMPELANR